MLLVIMYGIYAKDIHGFFSGVAYSLARIANALESIAGREPHEFINETETENNEEDNNGESD